jgi:hypothetical protein
MRGISKRKLWNCLPVFKLPDFVALFRAAANKTFKCKFDTTQQSNRGPRVTHLSLWCPDNLAPSFIASDTRGSGDLRDCVCLHALQLLSHSARTRLSIYCSCGLDFSNIRLYEVSVGEAVPSWTDSRNSLLRQMLKQAFCYQSKTTLLMWYTQHDIPAYWVTDYGSSHAIIRPLFFTTYANIEFNKQCLSRGIKHT